MVRFARKGRKSPRRVVVRTDADALRALNDVHKDKRPRIIERQGKPVAAVIDVSDLEKVALRHPTREEVEEALSLAGAWRDIDADEFKRYIYEGRRTGSRPLARPK